MTENVIGYKISSHAEVRYVERIMEKDNKNDINKFIADNKEKIKTDINKMIQYGECIFTGKQSQKDGKGNVLDVYLKDCWVVLVDNKSNIVVTLYKIDLQLGDEFNETYITKMMEKLNAFKEELVTVQKNVQEESNTYRSLIDDAEAQIREYKSMIKNLEELSMGYKTIIDNNNVRVSKANRDIADVVNSLIGKREF